MNMSKKTTEWFISKANIKHKNEYTYLKSNYIGTFNLLTITCSQHGDFNQRANNHLNGQGCPKCGDLKTKNKQKTSKLDFISKAVKIHGNSYDYSNSIYINNKTKLDIICPKHGIFRQTPDNHINKLNKCPKCFGRGKLSKEDFVKKCNDVHKKKYDYSKTNFTNVNSIVSIICPIHSEFKCKPSHHMSGIGCSKCSKKHKYSNKEFIDIANDIHGNKYEYSKINYINSKTKIIITCKNHGDFIQTPTSHLNKKGCPICVESKGEIEIRKFLTNHKIDFVPQKKFNDCINIETNRKLSFDFYLPKYNMCIEYQGKQHFVPVKKWGGINALEKIKNRDLIKKIYCEKKNINLLEISYLESVNKVLEKFI
jgi:hypothetical protein